MKTAAGVKKYGTRCRCRYIRDKFLYNQSLIQHRRMHRMCLGMVRQVKEQQGNKNQNELVMAVIKYGMGFYLQPVIKLPLPDLWRCLPHRAKPFFCQGHVNNLHGAFWIYWQMDILSNRALQTGKQVLKKASVSCLYDILVAPWLQPQASFHQSDPPKSYAELLFVSVLIISRSH